MLWSQVEMILNLGSITYQLQDRSKLLNLSVFASVNWGDDRHLGGCEDR